MKRDVWEGILLRHGLVEKAEDKTQVAAGQAYLCHLDRSDLIEEVRRLRRQLKDEESDRADERRSGGNYWGDMIGQDIEG